MRRLLALVVLNFAPAMAQVSISSSPSVSSSASQSQSSSATAGSPTSTFTGSNTAAMTATSSTTGSLSATSSATRTMTPTSSHTATMTSTASSTRSTTASPTASSHIQTAGLLVDMQATDFFASGSTVTWDNRVTLGPVSVANGDFVATGAASTYPTYRVVNSVPAVVFNGTATGTQQYMVGNATLPLYAGLYGNSDWTFETWILHSGLYNTAAESSTAPQSPVFQWGLKASTTCGSAHFGIGDSASDGAGGHYSCDNKFGPGPSTYQVSAATGIGFTPTVNQWHHWVVTYNGSAFGNESVYVDGRANSFVCPRNLNINVPTLMYLGTWFSSSTYFGGEFALGALRMHDHALTPAQVLFNYNADYLSYYPSITATPTQTATSSFTATSSASPTATNTATSTLSSGASPSISNTATDSPTCTPSNSPTVSTSPTATLTPSVSSRLQTATLLLDMQAVDYNAVTQSWDNRVTQGTVSSANGDFVCSGAASTYPTYALVNNVPAVVFNGVTANTQQYMTTNAALPLYAGLYGSSDWTYEVWILHTGSYNTVVESTTSPQSPVFQWGLRATTTCGSAHFGIGDSASDGAGGHYSCDLAFANSASTYKPSASTGIGYTPTINKWHHLVVTYNPSNGNETIFLDGLAVSYAIHSLAINVPVLMYLGAWYTASSNTYYGGEFSLGALRMHDHVLTPAQVLFNYNADWSWYNPSPTSTATPSRSNTGSPSATNSLTPTRSNTGSATTTPSSTSTLSVGASASPTSTPSQTSTITSTPTASASASKTASFSPTATLEYGAGCPSSFGGVTHYLKSVSFAALNDSSAYVRHCSFWLYLLPGFPEDVTSSLDATSVWRLGLDGTPGSVSLQSVNYQAYYLQVQADGYLQYSPNLNTSALQANATFSMLPGPNGSTIIRSHAVAGGLTLGLGNVGAHSCNANTWGIRALAAPTVETSFVVSPPLAAASAYTPPYQTDIILMESLASPGSYGYACSGTGGAGGATLSTTASVSWLNASATWKILPAMACPGVCGYSTFSLASATDPTGGTMLYVNSLGAIVTGPETAPDFSSSGASFLAQLVTINGTSGWVLSSALDYALGAVFTNTGVMSTSGGGCSAASSVVSAPVPASELTMAHLWRLFWSDGSGDITRIPTPLEGNATPSVCASPSISPISTSSASPSAPASGTPSYSGSSSFTPSASLTPTHTGSDMQTPSRSGSPSGTQLFSLSPTPSPSASRSSSPPGTTTASLTGSLTSTNTATASSSPTPSPSHAIAVGGAQLWVDLWAVDYNDRVYPQTWDNRASSGSVSTSNGDFVTSGANATFPRKSIINGVQAVVFNYSIDSVADSVTSSFAYFPMNSFYGNSDWSIEAWIYHTGFQTSSGVNAIAQFGPRPGTVCDSLDLNMGSNPTNGSISFYACDYGWSASQDTAAVPGSGFRPLPNRWHHVVYTYTGAAGAPAYLLSGYLNGARYLSAAQQLSIKRSTNPTIGTWTDAGNVGAFALAQFRIHDGVLTASQVATNFNAYAAAYIGTPSMTPTSSTTATMSPTGSPTSSPGSLSMSPTMSATGSSTGTMSGTSSSTRSRSASPSVTQRTSLSSTLTSTLTPSPSISASASPRIVVAGQLLLDLLALDYDTGAHTWDNRVTAGLVSYANGDMVAVGGAPSSYPTKGTMGGTAQMAVIFNVTAASVPQYVATNGSLPLFAGVYGSSDWSFEAWVLSPSGFTAYANEAENPLFSWSPRTGSSVCSSATVGIGSDASFGAGGHTSCDNNYGPGFGTGLVAGHGYTLSAGVWHYVAVTNEGHGGAETVYVDGAISSVSPSRNLSIGITASSSMYIGAWLDRNLLRGGYVAVGALRLHDGCLSSPAVSYNFAVDAARYIASPSATLSPTASLSGSLSTSPTRSPVSLSPSLSNTMTASSTTTRTMTSSMTPTLSATLSLGASPSFTQTQSATQTASQTDTPSPTGSPTGSQTGTRTQTSSPSSTTTPTQTPTPVNRPLTYGSVLVLRIGNGTSSRAAATLAPVYIDEYALPTASGVNATLLQTLIMTTPCSLTPSASSQGALTRAADVSQLVFACFANAPGGTQHNPVLYSVSPIGALSAPLSIGGIVGNASFPVGVASYNASWTYVTMSSSSSSANNGLWLWRASSGFTHEQSTDFSPLNYGKFGSLLPSPLYTGQPGLYMTYTGSTTGACPGCSIGATVAGTMLYGGTPGTTLSPLNPYDASQFSTLQGTTAVTAPRGFVFAPSVPPATLPAELWATDEVAGLFRFILAGGVWLPSAPYTIAGETEYAAVALSADGSTAYVSATAGIYAFATPAMAWLSLSPVVSPPGAGSYAALYKGMALSPVFPSPSQSPSSSLSATISRTMSVTSSASASASSTQLHSFSPTGSISASTSMSNSNTATQSATALSTPSASATRVSLSATPSSSASTSGSPTETASPSATASSTASASASGSRTRSPSGTFTSTMTASHSPTVLPTVSSTLSPTSTMTQSSSRTATPSTSPSSSGSPLLRTASLLADCRAEDYDSASGVWNSRAASPSGGISNSNSNSSGSGGADLVFTTNGTSAPGLGSLGGVTAILFNMDGSGGSSSGGGVNGTSVQTLFSPSASFSENIWGTGVWSVEMWVWVGANEGAEGASPVFQWSADVNISTSSSGGSSSGGDGSGSSGVGSGIGTREACTSAAVGVGSNPIWGALYHGDGCGIAWADGFGASAESTSGSIGGSGRVLLPEDNTATTGTTYRPSPNAWHHIVITYSGNETAVEMVYLDGALNQAVTYPRGHGLNVTTGNLRLGSWSGVGGGSFGLSQFRVYGGALTATDVAFNYGEAGPTVQTLTVLTDAQLAALISGDGATIAAVINGSSSADSQQQQQQQQQQLSSGGGGGAVSGHLSVSACTGGGALCPPLLFALTVEDHNGILPLGVANCSTVALATANQTLVNLASSICARFPNAAPLTATFAARDLLAAGGGVTLIIVGPWLDVSGGSLAMLVVSIAPPTAPVSVASNGAPACGIGLGSVSLTASSGSSGLAPLATARIVVDVLCTPGAYEYDAVQLWSLAALVSIVGTFCLVCFALFVYATTVIRAKVLVSAQPTISLAIGAGLLVGLLAVIASLSSWEHVLATDPITAATRGFAIQLFLQSTAFWLVVGGLFAKSYRVFRLVIAVVINPRLRKITIKAWKLLACMSVGLAVDFAIDMVWLRVSPPVCVPVPEPTDAAVTHLVCQSTSQVMLVFWILSKACIVAFLSLIVWSTRSVKSNDGETKTINAAVVIITVLTVLLPSVYYSSNTVDPRAAAVRTACVGTIAVGVLFGVLFVPRLLLAWSESNKVDPLHKPGDALEPSWLLGRRRDSDAASSSGPLAHDATAASIATPSAASVAAASAAPTFATAASHCGIPIELRSNGPTPAAGDGAAARGGESKGGPRSSHQHHLATPSPPYKVVSRNRSRGAPPSSRSAPSASASVPRRGSGGSTDTQSTLGGARRPSGSSYGGSEVTLGSSVSHNPSSGCGGSVLSDDTNDCDALLLPGTVNDVPTKHAVAVCGAGARASPREEVLQRQIAETMAATTTPSRGGQHWQPSGTATTGGGDEDDPVDMLALRRDQGEEDPTILPGARGAAASSLPGVRGGMAPTLYMSLLLQDSDRQLAVGTLSASAAPAADTAAALELSACSSAGTSGDSESARGGSAVRLQLDAPGKAQ